MKQMLFDKIVLKMISQGRPACDINGTYHYRCTMHRTVLNSPVGFLIPDSVYTLSMEEENVINLITETPALSVYVEYSDLIYALEDLASKPSYQSDYCHIFIAELFRLANRFELNTVVLSHFEHLKSWKVARMRATELIKTYNI